MTGVFVAVTGVFENRTGKWITIFGIWNNQLLWINNYRVSSLGIESLCFTG